ncbi:MAG TPA: peptidoglycan-binding protein [Chthoniobacterales bacterium]|jgi:hypothetical protein|nr:peptidoglycan-binding protein [Chthoniobacterales bacterium]
MKNPYVVVVAALAFSALSALAGGNNHGGGGGNSAPAVHSSSGSAPATPSAGAPHLSGVQHFGNGISQGARPMSIYRPTVTYKNGQRTFNYPAVAGSGVQRSAHANFANNTNATAIHGKSGNVQANAAITRLNRGNLRTGGNSQHAGAINLAAKHKLDPQSSARLRNWNGNVSSANQARQNHLNNLRHHHDHDWWRHHCVTFIFWDWGWWGWSDGWWYPAWGYDSYSYYGYNEPIYGDGDLTPEQIIASAQVALQQQGYYNFAIDGRMGAQTRAAIGQYQSDHRLPITYTVDAATLGSLGVIR